MASGKQRQHYTINQYLHSLFSSSVTWITRGTLKASWSHFVNMKGIKWPKCSASEEGPCRYSSTW